MNVFWANLSVSVVREYSVLDYKPSLPEHITVRLSLLLHQWSLFLTCIQVNLR